MIDLTKPIEFMDGTNAEVTHANNLPQGFTGAHVLVAKRARDRGDYTYIATDINGQIFGVQVIRNRHEPKKVAVEYWLNVYSNGTVASHDTKEHADEYAAEDRIACVHRYTIVEVGFGL